MALILDGTSGITSTGGSNVLQADSVTTSNLQNNAVTTAKINNAAVTIAKLSATGTPDATNFLRGDGSWQVISTTPTTAQVLTATAGASAGAVGTYAMLQSVAGGAVDSGNTAAGSSLRPAGRTNSSNYRQEPGRSGTWRCMGFGGILNAEEALTVWLRIS